MSKETLILALADKDKADGIVRLCRLLDKKMPSPRIGRDINLLETTYWHGYTLLELSDKLGIR